MDRECFWTLIRLSSNTTIVSVQGRHDITKRLRPGIAGPRPAK